MFAWGFMKAIDLGYLDKDEYLQTAKDSYYGLLANFVKFGLEGTIVYDGIVDECNLIGKVDLDYYYSRPKISQGNNGVGSFMMTFYEWETWAERA